MIIRTEIENEYVDAKQAEKILNLSPSRISRLCSSGRFEGAFKVGGSWLIPRKALDVHEPLPPGPKPKRLRGDTDRDIARFAITHADNLKKSST